MEATATAKETTSNLESKNCRWGNDIVQHLINSLLENKWLMAYKNLDYDTDKPMQYKEVRIKITSIYENQDQSLFGRVKAEALPEDFENLDNKREGFSQSGC